MNPNHRAYLCFGWLQLLRRTKRRHAEAEGLDEAVAMAGYETAGFSGYHSSAPSDYYGGA